MTQGDAPPRVLVILGHPRAGSFNESLCDAFCGGLRHAQVEFRCVRLHTLDFDPDVRQPQPQEQALETPLRSLQQDIAWAQHLVLIYPTWWGTYPARFKATLDRVLTPGFAFRFHADEQHWDRLLAGRTAELMTTMDTPPWVYRWIYGAPGHRGLRHATLGFCGIRTVRVTEFAPVVRSSSERRTAWLAQAWRRGRALGAGPLSAAQSLRARLGAWLKALRLQFYGMTWIGYALGAVLSGVDGVFSTPLFWIGFAALFALEAATVFSNERHDFPSDHRNANAGPFTGGSQVLVRGDLDADDLRRGSRWALILYGLCATVAMALSPASLWSVLIAASVLGALAMAYTAPPIKLSYRGWGELDVAATHSVAIVVWGYGLHAGHWFAPLPWLVALPLGLAVLPAIILSGVPDADADRQAGKRTLVVRWGIRAALVLAMAAAFAAIAMSWVLQAIPALSEAYAWVAWVVSAYGLVLLARLYSLWRAPPVPKRMDGSMALALGFILWFGLLPLIHFA